MNKENNQREKMVKRLREVLMVKRTDLPAEGDEWESLFRQCDTDLSVAFVQRFTRDQNSGAEIHYCTNEEEIGAALKAIQSRYDGVPLLCGTDNLTNFAQFVGVENCRTAKSGSDEGIAALLCEALTAWDGGIVVSDKQGLENAASAIGERVVVLAFTSQVLPEWKEVSDRMTELYKELPDCVIMLEPGSVEHLHLILIEDQIES